MTKKYYPLLNLLKYILAVLIVFIHVPTPYKDAIVPILKCAVPCFFIISGFFIGDINDKNKIIRSIKSVSKIAIYSTILYIICYFVIEGNVKVGSLKDWLLFNVTFISDHLWYLFAYLYVLAYYYLRPWSGINRMDLIAVLLLLIVNYVGGKYSIVFFGKEMYLGYVRNFLFTGIPFFTIGLLMRQYESCLLKISLQNLSLLTVAVLGGVYIERYLLLEFNLDSCSGDIYIFNAIASLLIVLWVIKLDDLLHFKYSFKQFAQQSLYLYVLHVFIYKCLLLMNLNVNNTFISYTLPFVIIILVWILSLLLMHWNALLKKKLSSEMF